MAINNVLLIKKFACILSTAVASTVGIFYFFNYQEQQIFNSQQAKDLAILKEQKEKAQQAVAALKKIKI